MEFLGQLGQSITNSIDKIDPLLLIWYTIGLFIVMFVADIIRRALSDERVVFGDLIIDGKTNSVSSSKVILLVGILVLVWGFVHMTVTSELNEWYVLIFTGALVFNRFSSRKTKVDLTKAENPTNIDDLKDIITDAMPDVNQNVTVNADPSAASTSQENDRRRLPDRRTSEE